MYIWGGFCVPVTEAAENDADNTVGKVITVGDSLTGGDIFNFTATSSTNYTAVRFYGENLNIPMIGSGVYTVNGNGGEDSIEGINFSSVEEVNTGGLGGATPSFVKAVGAVEGDWQLNLKTDVGTAWGVVIDGDRKYMPGSFDYIDDASDITFKGKLNIDIEGNGIYSLELRDGAKGTFKDDVAITGISHSHNFYMVFISIITLIILVLQF